MPGWYPSHMPRALQELRENLRLVDVAIELIDARIPRSSRLPDFERMKGSKSRVVAMNKADLADPEATRAWISAFTAEGVPAVAVNASTGDGVRALIEAARRLAQENFSGTKRLRPFRAMAVGIPNVGKSSLINRLAGRKSAPTGDRPGITRGKQWIRVAEDLELLDLPGILWPQKGQSEGFHLLCITGAVPDGSFDQQQAAIVLIELLRGLSPGALVERYGASGLDDPEEVLSSIARQRGFLLHGGTPDLLRASRALLSDFRSGRLGRITLELPNGLTQ